MPRVAFVLCSLFVQGSLSLTLLHALRIKTSVALRLQETMDLSVFRSAVVVKNTPQQCGHKNQILCL